jgi:hypothetical protein
MRNAVLARRNFERVRGVGGFPPHMRVNGAAIVGPTMQYSFSIGL